MRCSIGAAGVVGFGICDAWLNHESTTSDDDNSNVVTVYAVDKNEIELNKLSDKLGLSNGDTHDKTKNRLVTIVGDVSSEDLGLQLKSSIESKLVEAQHTLKHIVTCVGCPKPLPGNSGNWEFTSNIIESTKQTYNEVFLFLGQ